VLYSCLNAICLGLKEIYIKFGCFTKMYHVRGVWGEEGITCKDCGHFISKAEHMANLHSGSY